MRPPRAGAAAEKKPGPKAPHARYGSVEAGDEVYVQHPKHGPLALKVLACGRDGLTGECGEGRRHSLSYDTLLGHKRRVGMDLKVMDQGQDGAIVQDSHGRRRYLAGDLGAAGNPATGDAAPGGAKQEAEPMQRDPLLNGMDQLAKALEAGAPILLLKAQVKNAPGLALRDVTDKAGHQTKRWMRAAPEMKNPRQPGKGEAPAAPPPSYKHGDEVLFRHGEVRHRGAIVASGADGVTVRDQDGRHHQVRHQAIEGRADQVGPAKPEYVQRGDKNEKAYFKENVEAWPDPDHLPEDHSRYFNDHEDAETIPLNKIAISKTEGDKGARNAPKALAAAWHGALSKRDPVHVEAQEDGTYRVVDGNGTVAGVKNHGWKAIPAVVTNKEAQAEKIAQTLTTPEDEALPKSAPQPVQGEEDLYSRAPAALDELKTWLDKGKGVSSAMGHRLMTKSPDDVTDEEWASPEGFLFIAPLKGRERAAQKVKADYKGKWSELRDVVRCSIALPNMDQVKATMDRLRESGMVLAQKPKNRFAKPVDVGYRDMLLNVRLPSGLICEVQLHAKPMLAAKAEGHHWYGVQRDIDAKLATEDREPTEDEKAKMAEAVEKQKAIYAAAWAKSAGRKGDVMAKAMRGMRRLAAAAGKAEGKKMGQGHVFIEHEGSYYRANAEWPAVRDILEDGAWKPYQGSDRVKPWVYGDRVDDPLAKAAEGDAPAGDTPAPEGQDAPAPAAAQQPGPDQDQAPSELAAKPSPMTKAFLSGLFFWRR